MPDTLAWGNPFLRLDILPMQQLLASILYILYAKFLDASEEVALFRKQANILVRGSENNAINFSFLPTIFHSYVMCVLQSPGQARKQKAAASSHLLQSGPGGQGSVPGNCGLAGCLDSTHLQQNRGGQVSSKPIKQSDGQCRWKSKPWTALAICRIDFIGSYFQGEGKIKPRKYFLN